MNAELRTTNENMIEHFNFSEFHSSKSSYMLSVGCPRGVCWTYDRGAFWGVPQESFEVHRYDYRPVHLCRPVHIHTHTHIHMNTTCILYMYSVFLMTDLIHAARCFLGVSSVLHINRLLQSHNSV